MTNSVEDEAKHIVGITLKFCINNSRIILFITGSFTGQIWILMALGSQIMPPTVYTDTLLCLFSSQLQENCILTTFFKN